MPINHLFIVVLIASLLGFGGLGSLPVLQSQLAADGVDPGPVVLPALAVGNISPGPNGLYLIAASYFIGGIVGSLAACAAVILPPFLVLVMERVRQRLIHLPRFRAMLRSLSLAVVALLALTDWSLVQHAATGPVSILVMAASTLLLLLRLPPLIGVVGAIAAGIGW